MSIVKSNAPGSNAHRSQTAPEAGKYAPYGSEFSTELPDRQWPNNTCLAAPEWCSVDLRDGNQALRNPMNVAQKMEFYDLLVRMGFNQIEIGFPSASDIDRLFTRQLIEDKLIPQGVRAQVLVAAREDLVRETLNILRGAPLTIVHVYNSTSKLQREIVFRMTKDQILQMAVDATAQVRRLADSSDTDIQYEYSPESFTGTERQYALDLCNAVIDAWEPTPERKMILNLPATVEMSTPNVYADLIEFMSRNIHRRDSVTISVHPHNDRGSSSAAAELALLAGAERVEGTLFGNGERAGNVDLVILGLNLFGQGIDPKLDFRNLPHIQDVYERCTGMKVPERHPYAGDLATVAFSGTHQNAIRRGLDTQSGARDPRWRVPYLPLDFNDLGRAYQPIEVNSQSGKNGIAYVLRENFKIEMPKAMEGEFAKIVQQWADEHHVAIPIPTLWELFEAHFVSPKGPLQFTHFVSQESASNSKKVECVLELVINGHPVIAEGVGNGPIDAAVHALESLGQPLNLKSMTAHSLVEGSDSKAVAYVQVERNGVALFGVAMNENTELATIKALVAGANRLASS